MKIITIFQTVSVAFLNSPLTLYDSWYFRSSDSRSQPPKLSLRVSPWNPVPGSVNGFTDETSLCRKFPTRITLDRSTSRVPKGSNWESELIFPGDGGATRRQDSLLEPCQERTIVPSETATVSNVNCSSLSPPIDGRRILWLVKPPFTVLLPSPWCLLSYEWHKVFGDSKKRNYLRNRVISNTRGAHGKNRIEEHEGHRTATSSDYWLLFLRLARASPIRSKTSRRSRYNQRIEPHRSGTGRR